MVDALTAAIEARGGTVMAGRPVRRVVVEDGRATGVELEPAEPGGEPELLPADVVIATVASGVSSRGSRRSSARSTARSSRASTTSGRRCW